MLRKLFFSITILSLLIFLPCYYFRQYNYMSSLKQFFVQKNRNFITLKHIDIRGHTLVSSPAILRIIDIQVGEKLYFISVNKIRNHLLQFNEFINVTVKINYLGVLSVKIFEHKPFGIWWDRQYPWLINNKGEKILKIRALHKYKKLIIVFGQDFHNKLKNFLDLVKIYLLYEDIKGLHYVGNRRWDIYTQNNIVIKLPENNIGIAIIKSKEVLRDPKFYNKIDIIDLRLHPKRLFLRLKSKI